MSCNLQQCELGLSWTSDIQHLENICPPFEIARHMLSNVVQARFHGLAEGSLAKFESAAPARLGKDLSNVAIGHRYVFLDQPTCAGIAESAVMDEIKTPDTLRDSLKLGKVAPQDVDVVILSFDLNLVFEYVIGWPQAIQHGRFEPVECQRVCRSHALRVSTSEGIDDTVGIGATTDGFRMRINGGQLGLRSL